MEFPAWDCLPYDRVSPHARRRGAAHDRAVAARARQGPRQAVGAAHHGERRAAARAGARLRRHACAVGRARQRARHGRHRRMAGAQRLHPRLDRARAGRIRGARRHPRSVSAGHGHAGAARFLRRRAGDDPHASIAQTQRSETAMRGARSGAGRRIPAHHRDHPPLPHRLCRGVRRRRRPTICCTRR